MEKVRWGVIGAGGIADRRTIPGIMLAENASLTAVMEVDAALAEALRAKYNAAHAYTTAEILLSDTDVDAVYISSPVMFHKEQAVLAAKAGKHVLLEKPFALNGEGALEVVQVCREQGVLLAPGFMMRFHNCHQQMRNMIQAGQLGQVVSCRCQFSCWYPEMAGNWRSKKVYSGGGALLDMGIHAIDLLQFITGAKAKRVTGFSGTKTFNYEVDDSSATLMELENGAYAYVDAHFNIPSIIDKCKVEIYGTGGVMLAEGTMGQEENGYLHVISADGKARDVQAECGNLYAKEIESFSRSILNGSQPEVSAEDAAQLQKVIEMAYLASEYSVIYEVNYQMKKED